EGATQLAIVVDLAVERQGDTPVVAAHRLAPACDVDDRKPAVREGRAALRLGPKALAVGAPMRHETRHATQALAVQASAVSERYCTGDAAHAGITPARSSRSSRYNATCASTRCSADKRPATSRRAAAASGECPCVIARSIASASATGHPGATRSAADDVPTASGTPPTAVATTGTSARIASSSVFGNPSLREGRTTRSRLRYTKSTSDTCPRKGTHDPTPRRLPRASRRARSGPSPAMS